MLNPKSLPRHWDLLKSGILTASKSPKRNRFAKSGPKLLLKARPSIDTPQPGCSAANTLESLATGLDSPGPLTECAYAHEDIGGYSYNHDHRWTSAECQLCPKPRRADQTVLRSNQACLLDQAKICRITDNVLVEDLEEVDPEVRTDQWRSTWS